MGICKYQRDYVRDFALTKASGKEMMELGDQVINPTLAEEIGFNVAKPYYSSLGYKHTSVDTNGNNGAIPHDLTKENKSFENKFDVITNHGTSEHIIDQYSLFKNLHDWGNLGCVYVHVVPMDSEEHKELIGRPWPRHGFWEYNTNFWVDLAEACGYELVSSTTEVRNPAVNFPLNYYSSGVYIKRKDSKFINKEGFNNLMKNNLKRCYL